MALSNAPSRSPDFQYQLYSDIAAFTTVVATGVVTPLVYGSNYSISPLTNSPAGNGSLIFFGPLPVGTNLTIDRAVPITQLTTWTPNDPNPSTAIQDAVDKITMILQDPGIPDSDAADGWWRRVSQPSIFSMAAIGSSQYRNRFNDTTSLAVGNNVQISNVANTMFGQITAIAGLNLTITTLAIHIGTAWLAMRCRSVRRCNWQALCR